MKDCDDRNLIGVDLVDDNVGQAGHDPLVGSRRAANMSGVWPQSQAIGSLANASDNLGRGAWILLLDVFVNILDIEPRAPPISNFHSPHLFQSAAISSSLA
jgi:hypothetical protein